MYFQALEPPTEEAMNSAVSLLYEVTYSFCQFRLWIMVAPSPCPHYFVITFLAKHIMIELVRAVLEQY